MHPTMPTASNQISCLAAPSFTTLISCGWRKAESGRLLSMDASQRWETEALRTGSQFRKTPPTPPAEDTVPEPKPIDADANWVTLREAEAETGIPLNTLRKWSRKSAVPSYLESDGELSLRMVDLDAVITHAHELGRETAPVVDHLNQEEEEPIPPESTLIVPLDAWNKMLNQLGNLHEAGQQLAEASERAAKAETEATFLRERLAEMRAENTEMRAQSTEMRAQNTEHRLQKQLYPRLLLPTVPLSRGTAEERQRRCRGMTRSQTKRVLRGMTRSQRPATGGT